MAEKKKGILSLPGLTKRNGHVEPKHVFTANFKRHCVPSFDFDIVGKKECVADIVMDICSLDVEHALPWCACLALKTLSTMVEQVGGFNVLFLDSFGSFQSGVEPVLREMLRMRLLSFGPPPKTKHQIGQKRIRKSPHLPQDVFLCFASSHRGESDTSSWRRRVSTHLQSLLFEFGYTNVKVEPHILAPEQIKPYRSMMFHAFWLRHADRKVSGNVRKIRRLS